MLSQPLKVLYVAHLPNLTGASRSMLDLIAGLDRSEVEPTVLIPHHGPMESKLKELAVPYDVLRYKCDTKSKVPVKTIAKLAVMPFEQRGVDNYIAEHNYDLVHCNSLFALTAARAAAKLRTPYICHCREFMAEDHEVRFLNEDKTRKTMQNASCLVFISGAVEQKFHAWAPNTKFVTLFNGLDVSRYMLPDHDIFRGDITELLLPGRFQPGKGQLDAIKAVEILKSKDIKAHLTLIGGIGDQAYYDSCCKYVKDNALVDHVSILDFADDLKELQYKSDITLMCSHNEAMGRVTIEGMLAGSLVIGANAGATPELIEDGKTGYLYEDGNPQALAECIEKALSDKESSRSIAAHAQSWAAGCFDNKQYAAKMTKLYKELMKV